MFDHSKTVMGEDGPTYIRISSFERRRLSGERREGKKSASPLLGGGDLLVFAVACGAERWAPMDGSKSPAPFAAALSLTRKRKQTQIF